MRVRFYHNAADPIGLACELIGRAVAGGRRVAIRAADPAAAEALDATLWTFEPGSFLPHVRVGSPLQDETPVVVGHADSPLAWPHRDLLFNMAHDTPRQSDGFRMVVEIVGQNDDERFRARTRWMHYRSVGAEIQAFDALRRERM